MTRPDADAARWVCTGTECPLGRNSMCLLRINYRPSRVCVVHGNDLPTYVGGIVLLTPWTWSMQSEREYSTYISTMIWLIHCRYSKSVNGTLCISSCGPESAPTTMYDRCTVELQWRWTVELTSHPKSSLQTFWAKYDQLWGINSHPRLSWKTNGESEKRPALNTSKPHSSGQSCTRLARRTWANVAHWTGARRGRCLTHLGRGELFNQIPQPQEALQRDKHHCL